jgi:hypothetical protein
MNCGGGDLQIETHDGQHHFRVELILGGVDPEAVQVKLCAAAPEGSTWRQPMTRGGRSWTQGKNGNDSHLYIHQAKK